jgi:transposase
VIARILLPDSRQLSLDWINVIDEVVHLSVHPLALQASCPECEEGSFRVHSRYLRKPADLPCGSMVVQLHIEVRRFFCDNLACYRRIFTERLPEIIAPYARRTQRLAETQKTIAFSNGGEAGARLTTKLGMPTSPDTLLRIIRASADRDYPCPRVLGVDDWAMRKGHTYGTILVDLERQQVVDLLPNRKPETLVQWLQAHPQVEIISRDRGQEYIDGITQGAPEVAQVADRFHLLQNGVEVLERVLKRCPQELQQAAKQVAAVSQPELSMVEPQSIENGSHQETEQPQEDTTISSSYRQTRFDQVKVLQAQGLSRREIARQLRIDRRTVSKYFHLEAPPQRSQPTNASSKAFPYLAYLQRRWSEGCHNLSELHFELQAKGFTGSYASLRRAVHRSLGVGNLKTATLPPNKPVVFSPRQAAWICFRPEEELSSQQVAFRQAVCQASAVVASASTLAQKFRKMVTERESGQFEGWLQQAEGSQVVEFERFAASLRSDFAAVQAALTYSWSNGQVEGQVNRLKLIKREMYGRASFSLLRKRVLETGSASP